MHDRLLYRLALTCCVSLPGVALASDSSGGSPAPQDTVLAKALDGPMKDVQDVIFAVRLGYDDPHWYANIGYYCDDENLKAYAGNGKPDVGKLCKLNVRSGQMTVLLDTQGGSIRDPEVHYDADKVLFSYRKADSDYYHLYEINLDGTGLKQITSGEFDDYEAAYLPDGGIVFVSTRCRCWVNCWKTQVGVLYRCDADGSNIQRLSHNAEHDNTPSVLPDGRILYTRWEYVDRSQVQFHHLWTMNPDGTSQMVYYGNMHPGIVMIDSRPIPGTQQVLSSFSPGHGVTDHKGFATIVTPAKGPDTQASARRLHNHPLIKDPYPLSNDCILAARTNQILIMDGAGKTQPIYRLPGEGAADKLGPAIHEPRAVIRRPRERVLPSRIDPQEPTGQLVLTNAYLGRHLDGVQRGEIDKLLVLEVLPKPVNFSGGPDLVSWLGTFTLERVLGTVPVEDDGSAYFEVPAGRAVFFVALDENDRSIKRMHSFVSVMPGERTSCVGCHEPRTMSPPHGSPGDLAALKRPPSQIERFAGLPDVIDFPRDIQPILDRNCIECHGYERREGNVLLTGDLGPQWSHSFFNLFAHRQVADGRNGLGNSAPRTIGSAASPLMDKLDPSHHDVSLTPDEWRTVWLWVESGAPYAGSYAGLRNEEEQKLGFGPAFRALHQSSAVLRRRCNQCHAVGQVENDKGRALPYHPDLTKRRQTVGRPTANHERIVFENDPLTQYSGHILVNMTRPEYSPLLLGPLSKQAGGWESCGPVFTSTEDVDYQWILATLQKAKREADAKPRYATNAFRPNRQYVRELKKYGVLPAGFDTDSDPIDFFQTDEAYWQSFWHSPPSQ